MFKIKVKITGETSNNDEKDVEIILPLNYLSNIWRAFEMPLISCIINLDLNWSKKCVVVATALANN